ncbi:DUF2946 domain-containing protein [Acinetobacter beijerinckii]|uniref:DUF2946 domain-containing protein n=1 Tax=Acinetobacter beijerinckii TaxID=262668 RepID=UPI003AF506CA
MRISIVLALFAMLFQIAVFLQPLLPEQYQIARVCQSVAEIQQKTDKHHAHLIKHNVIAEIKQTVKSNMEHQHDVHHHCMFCAVYSHLISNLDSDLPEIFARIQVRLIAFQKAFRHILFELQRLFLSPQGRAPPLLT